MSNKRGHQQQLAHKPIFFNKEPTEKQMHENQEEADKRDSKYVIPWAGKVYPKQDAIMKKNRILYRPDVPKKPHPDADIQKKGKRQHDQVWPVPNV
jgi:hypothetical protein